MYRIVKKAISNKIFVTTPDKPIKCITITMKLSKIKTIRISEIQHKTLVKMKFYNIDVGRFIREAIKEKINREYEYLKPKEEKDSFLKSLYDAISK